MHLFYKILLANPQHISGKGCFFNSVNPRFNSPEILHPVDGKSA
jgi:hypothetical protein